MVLTQTTFVGKVLTIAVEDLARGIPQLGGILNKDHGFIRAFFPEAHQLLLRRVLRINKMVEELRENDAKAVAKDKHRLSTFEIESESDRARAESLDKLEEEIFIFCEITFT